MFEKQPNVYGSAQKISLRQLIAQTVAGTDLKPYGLNESPLLDALAHLELVADQLDELYKTAVGQEEISPFLLNRLKSKDEAAYTALVCAGVQLSYEREEARVARQNARVLANALNDINNLIGEDACVKLTFSKVERVVDLSKWQLF